MEHLDPVCSYFVQGKSYPIYHRNLLISQIPSLKNKFKTYEEYARATFDDIFPPADQKDAYIRDCRFFESAWIENLGNGAFKMHPLPIEAQISPVFGMLSGDYNKTEIRTSCLPEIPILPMYSQDNTMR